MQQFSNVLIHLRKWFEQFRWFHLIRQYDMHILFGSLGLITLRTLLYRLFWDSYDGINALNTLFYDIPLAALSDQTFLLGIWITLVSRNINYVPYAMWIYAVVTLFPFTDLSFAGLLKAAIYAFLGYWLFRYTASAHANESVAS
ncbi:hypothetical protein DNH61_18630 [Paenibacillus sambharensis]|uniref:Uncharacterized protein n=1 Tax=Paenibacillus sambharensis TaxID=1803190 RepID=A0A2W1L4Z9_9BACL|nr:hypothetical protein [Paenibacillus sambharensis]PZD94416.1 hypothetical protein DNH61_18630 [Paenibacillus sambharensis]